MFLLMTACWRERWPGSKGWVRLRRESLRALAVIDREGDRGRLMAGLGHDTAVDDARARGGVAAGIGCIPRGARAGVVLASSIAVHL